MKNFRRVFFGLIILFSLNACKKERDVVAPTTKFTIKLLAPKNVAVKTYKKATILLSELNTGYKLEKPITNGILTVEVPRGSYQLVLDGEISYTFKGTTLESGIGAQENNLILNKDKFTTQIEFSLKSTHKDFIIEEIFFTGTLTPQKKQYLGDKYFKIYNNTSETLYADGLIIAESEFLTVDKQDYTPNIMKEAFSVSAAIQIPGSGKDYPVLPGKSFIVASDAINHKENNSNSFDLSKADFEFYYPKKSDVDNPQVPNTINLYSAMVIHNRGFKSYVLGRMPEKMTKEAYLKTHIYTYKWTFEFNGMSFPMSNKALKMPNTWIIDAVNLSVESEFQWIVTDNSLDTGWSYCGKTDHDKDRYGKSVKRKVIQEKNGRKLLQDTNNSTVDFMPEVQPSLAL